MKLLNVVCKWRVGYFDGGRSVLCLLGLLQCHPWKCLTQYSNVRIIRHHEVHNSTTRNSTREQNILKIWLQNLLRSWNFEGKKLAYWSVFPENFSLIACREILNFTQNFRCVQVFRKSMVRSILRSNFTIYRVAKRLKIWGNTVQILKINSWKF